MKINTHRHNHQWYYVKQNEVQNVEEFYVVVFAIHYANCLCNQKQILKN